MSPLSGRILVVGVLPLSIAGALGDLPGSDRTLVETALEAARRALRVAL